MKRFIPGILVGLSFSAMGVFIAINTIKRPPRMEETTPIAAAIGVVVAVWLNQGAVIAFLARRKLGGLPVLKTRRVYLATRPSARIRETSPRVAGRV